MDQSVSIRVFDTVRKVGEIICTPSGRQALGEVAEQPFISSFAVSACVKIDMSDIMLL